jgi:hypothetical protein
MGELRLNSNLPKDKFMLVNNHISMNTGKPYQTLGEIYSDILSILPAEAEVVNFMDDDDVYFPNHIEEGIKGLERGGLKAYKAKYSYFRYLRDTNLSENNLEPSVFVKADHIREHGFSDETTAQHLKWLQPLYDNNEIFMDPEGPPTYICDWSQEIGTFKTSGDPHNPKNFANYDAHSQDLGDGIITPCSKSWAERYCRIKENHA